MQDRRRMRIEVQGLVQGVGFRPFVYRLARQCELSGWVCNTPGGVVIEIEGSPSALDEFEKRLRGEAPSPAQVRGLRSCPQPATGVSGFVIRESRSGPDHGAWIMPDLASCPQCLAEVLDPANRRYGYPFTTCTYCGPRYSIMDRLPYDRAQTAMRDFTMCDRCRAEYVDPGDRRFHAQTNACPDCGPRLSLWDAQGRVIDAADAVAEAAQAIRRGRIVAVKGLGGFHLLADAFSKEAVQTLRRRKQRPDKPLAVMFPSRDQLNLYCQVAPLEEQFLSSPVAPIVLLTRRERPGGPALTEEVAPGNPLLGAFLPYTPLHHLLLRRLGQAVVATSGNRADEPICIDQTEAAQRLAGIADLFLVHNRPIRRPVDDSVQRVMAGQVMTLRRARGLAPLPVVTDSVDEPVLAVGGQLKNTVALQVRDQVFLSQHLGDLSSLAAQQGHRQAVADLETLLGARARQAVCDRHPDYFSRTTVDGPGQAVTAVQHHHAHIVACMAEHQLTGEVLGVSWDGTGYGEDRTIWGGEFLRCTRADFERVACLRPFCLPGGEEAVREPRRAACGLLAAIYGEAILDRADLVCLRQWSREERVVLSRMIRDGINAPWTSSAGRLFDGVAALIGLRQVASFEGQAAMDLEFSAAVEAVPRLAYSCPLIEPEREGDPAWLDWSGLIAAIVQDQQAGVPVAQLAARFHWSLIDGIVAVARRVGCPRVVLSGGCFQNRYLTEGAVQALTEAGFRPYWHRDVPPNDGGLALGQAVIGAARWSGEISRPGEREEARGCV